MMPELPSSPNLPDTVGPPPSLSPDLPRELVHLVEELLEKAPELLPASAADVARRLAVIAAGIGAGSAPHGVVRGPETTLGSMADALPRIEMGEPRKASTHADGSSASRRAVWPERGPA